MRRILPLLALTLAACDQTAGDGPPGIDSNPDAGTPVMLELNVRTPCRRPVAPVGGADQPPVRIGVQLSEGGRLSERLRADVHVYLTEGDALALPQTELVTVQGTPSTLLAHCLRAGDVRIGAEAADLHLTATPVAIHCAAAAELPRLCPELVGPPPEGQPDAGPADATPPGPADAAVPAPSLEPQPVDPGPLAAYGARRTVAFRLHTAEGAPWPDQPITFALDPPGARHRLDPTAARTDANGFAATTLETAGDVGPVAVVASLDAADLDVHTRSAALEVVPGPLRPSGLRIDCGTPALAAFDAAGTPVAGQIRRCAVVAHDPGDRPLPGIPVKLLAEAGHVPDQVVTAEDGTAAFSYRTNPEGPHRGAGGPADGLAALIAAAPGEEDFDDRDGDHVFTDPGDTFGPAFDLPEPWVDANDDGARSPDEAFLDVDGDRSWSPANGHRDTDGTIFSRGGLLWVGPHDPAQSHVDIDCGGVDCRPDDACDAGYAIRRGGRANLRLVVADARGNCVRTTSGARWTASWLGAPPQSGLLDEPCFAGNGTPSAQPQQITLDGLSAPPGEDHVRIRVSVTYDAVAGQATFEANVALCLDP